MGQILKSEAEGVYHPRNVARPCAIGKGARCLNSSAPLSRIRTADFRARVNPVLA